MPLHSGDRLGPYEIVAPLGAGGMGEVYRARDTKLDRDVAIKILPELFAQDAERLVRFEREAKTLASLNHPNIAQIYGIEDRALVMELVEGDDLSVLIARGPIALADAMPMARQIAEALEAAHEQGIIHRDLKPANIKVRPNGTVKVLDFGLAKAMDPAGSSAVADGAMNSPTLTARATQMGMIIGTAAYMAPEQARGRAVDRRADVWAFGVVLYEMLTGRRAFEGDDISITLASVLKEDVSWQALPTDLPVPVRRVLRRCLEKDPKRRLSSIGDARLELDEALAPVDRDGGGVAAAASAPAAAAVVVPAWKRSLPWVAGALGGIVVAGIATWAIMRPDPPTPPQLTRFAFAPSTAAPLTVLAYPERFIALSPGGTHVAYVTLEGALVVRAIDRLDAEPIRGITGARHPFFSPDGGWIGFFLGNELRKVAVNGGPTVRICSIIGLPRGASWGPDDTIVFGTADGTTGLLSVSSAGGDSKVLSKIDQATSVGADHMHPSVLPDGRILFTMTAPQVENAQVAVLDPKTGAIKELIQGGGQPEFVPFDFARGVPSHASHEGYLIYGVPGSLRAVRFDASRLELKGDPVPVLDQVSTTNGAGANFAVSRTGTLVYVPGGLVAAGAQRTLVWIDRQGRETPINAEPRAYYTVRLSPDDTRAVAQLQDRQNDVWVWNFGRETLTALTFDPQTEGFPTWTPDNQRIVFSSTRTGSYSLFSQAADGTGAPVRLTTTATGNNHLAADVLPDGRIVMVSRSGVNDDIGVWTKDKPEFTPLINTATAERNPAVSPDGKWLAYESYETTPPQIYVRPFPDVNAGKWQISKSSGVRPVWSRDGRELYFLSSATGATVTLYVVAIPTTPSNAGNPVKLFDVPNVPNQQNGWFYDVAKNGRFLFIKNQVVMDQTGSALPTLVVVSNWFEELKSKVVGR